MPTATWSTISPTTRAVPGDIVVVRLLYEYPVYVSLLGLNLADMAGGKRLIVATVGVPQRALSMRRVMLRVQPS